jgi:acetolactate synthase regulatory subunit
MQSANVDGDAGITVWMTVRARCYPGTVEAFERISERRGITVMTVAISNRVLFRRYQLAAVSVRTVSGLAQAVAQSHLIDLVLVERCDVRITPSLRRGSGAPYDSAD